MNQPLFEHTPIHQITRADGFSKPIRVQDGHLFYARVAVAAGRTRDFLRYRSMNSNGNGSNAAFGGGSI